MAVDLSVFQNIKTKADYDRLNDEFALKQALAAHAIRGNLPAALQVANAMQGARAAGNTSYLNDIQQSQKIMDHGIVYDENGNATVLPGYAPAVGGLAFAKGQGQEQGQKNVDLTMDPQIKTGVTNAENAANLVGKPPIERANSIAQKTGSSQGENEVSLNNQLAYMPQLEQTVSGLKDLSNTATYGHTGNVIDSVVRQTGPVTGFTATPGAVAATKYENTVNDVLLPQLRQTFGAQFTEREGQKLEGTLGDPTKSPLEKQAALDTFMEQKKQTVNSVARAAGQPIQVDPNAMTPPPQNPSSMPPPAAISQMPAVQAAAQQQDGPSSIISPQVVPQGVSAAPAMGSPSNIPMQAANALINNPQLRGDFDAKYGQGMANYVLMGPRN